MSEDGYTLVEMLVALAIIGLVLGGLFEGMQVAGRMQGSAARTLAVAKARRAVGEDLASLLVRQGPFQSDKAEAFTGRLQQFRFKCGEEAVCGAAVTRAGGGLRVSTDEPDGTQRIAMLPGVSRARFSYAGTRTVEETWPTPSTEPQTLRSVSLLAEGAGEAPIATVRLWSEQEIDCAYDSISRRCRELAK